jgi:hypothetical protein
MVSAHDDGLVGIITTNSDVYGKGEQIDVQFHLFDRGERVDADDDVVLDMELHSGYESESREIQTQRTDKCLYEASIGLYDSDLEGKRGATLIPVNSGETPYGEPYAVSTGRDSENDTTYDYLGRWDIDASGFTFDNGEESPLDIDYTFLNPEDYSLGAGRDGVP